MTPNILINPYGTDTSSLTRLQIWVGPEDRQLIRAITPVRGFETFAVAVCLQALARSLRQNNITTFTHANASALQSFVVDELPAAILAAGERYFAHDTGGTPSGVPASAHPANQPTVPREATHGGRRNPGRSRRGRKSQEESE